MRKTRTSPPIQQFGVLGIDPSLASTGYSYRVGNDLYTGRITTAPLKGPQRLVYTRNELLKVIDSAQPSLIAYEDYAMGATGKTFHIGEMGGVLQTAIWERGIDLLFIGNSQMKLMIAGHGHAAKDAADALKKSEGKKKLVPNIRDSIQRISGYQLNQNDEADAFGLMFLGEIYAGRPTPTVANTIDLATLKSCKVVKGKRK